MDEENTYTTGENYVDIPVTEETKFENLLILAEQKYGNDIIKLQDAVIRTKKLGLIHIMGLHYRLRPLFKMTLKLLVENAFYKWKSESRVNRAYRFHKVSRLLKYLYKKILIKAFLTFREKCKRIPFERQMRKSDQSYKAASVNSEYDEDLN